MLAADSVLGKMRKGFTSEQASRSIRDTSAAAIPVFLNLIVGFPGETEEDFRRTLDFLRQHAGLLSCVSTGETCGLPPGSPIHAAPARYGLATDPQGRVLWDSDGGWYTVEGNNNIRIRRERLMRLRSSLEEWGVVQAPRP